MSGLHTSMSYHVTSNGNEERIMLCEIFNDFYLFEILRLDMCIDYPSVDNQGYKHFWWGYYKHEETKPNVIQTPLSLLFSSVMKPRRKRHPHINTETPSVICTRPAIFSLGNNMKMMKNGNLKIMNSGCTVP